MKYIIFSLLSLISFFSFGQSTGSSAETPFTVVLDAGHGGKDPGSQKYGYNEKDIALKVALQVGKNLEKYKDVKVIYTRTTDVFVPLSQRASKANKAKADLFVSIHLNAVDNVRPHGTETFVLGIHNNKQNLEFAMKENSVIYLEDNFEETYNGFDPMDPTSYIGMTLMQEEYLDQSIVLADKIQREYTDKLRRVDRGVKKAGLLVLRETYMPSVLTEIGFITNKQEAQYLNSQKGVLEISLSISNGIVKYKDALNLHLAANRPENTTASAQEIQQETEIYEGVAFRVQIGVGSKPLETAPYNFKGLNGVERVKEGEFYKYYYGKTADYNQIENLLNQAKKQGFKEAFIVAFKDGKKISVDQARKS